MSIPLPSQTEFAEAGFDRGYYVAMQRRWPLMSRDEQEGLLARLERLTKMQAEDRAR